MARVKFAQGEQNEVEEIFQEILKIAGQISPKAVEEFQLWEVHYQLHRGKKENSQIWVQELGLTADTEFDFDQRFEYQNFARLLIIQGEYSKALTLVQTLLKIVSSCGATIYTIQYQVLQAIILQKLNQYDEAMTVMETALSFARAEGYVRSILDEGEAVGNLLEAAIANRIEVEYASKLLTAFRDEPNPSILERIPGISLVDPLSHREMEVLRLLVTDLTTPEIADILIVSVSTVRSHIKNLYSKLDVHSRYEAVTKAKDLHLL